MQRIFQPAKGDKPWEVNMSVITSSKKSVKICRWFISPTNKDHGAQAVVKRLCHRWPSRAAGERLHQGIRSCSNSATLIGRCLRLHRPTTDTVSKNTSLGGSLARYSVPAGSSQGRPAGARTHSAPSTMPQSGIHCDLRPANIRLNQKVRSVTDFGMARLIGSLDCKSVPGRHRSI